jgi:hypothetical protein
MVESYFRPYFEMLLRVIDSIAGQPLPADVRLRIGFSIIGQCLFYRVSRPIISMFVSDSDYEQDFSLDTLAEHISSFSAAAIRSAGKGASPTSDRPISVG